MAIKPTTYKKYCLIIDEWFLNGMNGTKAYQKHNPDSNDENAATAFIKILGNSKVQGYVASKRLEVKNNYDIRKDELIQELKLVITRFNELYDLANEDSPDPKKVERFKRLSQMFKASDLIKAIERISKMTGLDEPTKIEGDSLGAVNLVIKANIVAPLTSEKQVEEKYDLDDSE